MEIENCKYLLCYGFFNPNVNIILLYYPVYAIYENKKASDVDQTPVCENW